MPAVRPLGSVILFFFFLFLDFEASEGLSIHVTLLPSIVGSLLRTEVRTHLVRLHGVRSFN